MVTISAHAEPHYSTRNNWLRATVLGANDGLISTASLLMGMVAAQPSRETILLAGVAALIGGAVSMAAGEYVSVSSQSDTERADLRKEAHELTHNPDNELRELIAIYQQRGLDAELAERVAIELTKHNALEAHARDEIGIIDTMSANPFQAALASALAFCMGAIPPIAMLWFVPLQQATVALSSITLIGLIILGTTSAKLGGAPVLPAVCRVVIWGVVALASTAAIGHWFHVTI